MKSLLIIAAIEEIIPFWNQVVQRAANGTSIEIHTCLAEGNTAVRTAAGLLPALPLRQRLMELIVVLNALLRSFLPVIFSLIFQ